MDVEEYTIFVNELEIKQTTTLSDYQWNFHVYVLFHDQRWCYAQVINYWDDKKCQGNNGTAYHVMKLLIVIFFILN